MTTAETITAIISAIGTSGGLWIAYQGLHTWKKQLFGNTEYELSRRIIISLLKYKSAIDAFRVPAIYSYEIPELPDGAKYKNDAYIEHYRMNGIYQARWDKISAAGVDLQANIVEGETIWGEEFTRLFDGLKKLENELFKAVREHIRLLNPEVSEETKEIIKARSLFQDELRNPISACFDNDEDDKFDIDLLKQIKSIKDFLKPKLTH